MNWQKALAVVGVGLVPFGLDRTTGARPSSRNLYARF